MIRLDKTTRKLQAVMAGAKNTTEPSVTVSFFDENVTGLRTKGATQIATLNDTTDVDICAAPPQNFVRNIDTINVFNPDAVAQVVTIKIDDNGTDTKQITQTLQPNGTLQYEHGYGWSR